jgi:hypothetical protein
MLLTLDIRIKEFYDYQANVFPLKLIDDTLFIQANARLDKPEVRPGR